MGRSLRIAFLHPNLGIGGAERLVIDAAVSLQAAGHRVTVFTAHRDPGRCFAEARDGTLDVRVHGNLIPFDIGGRLRAPCAIARMHVGAVALLRDRPDVIFADVVAQVVPFLRLLGRAPVILYCHYPDHLLTPPRRGLYALYRAPLDRWEEIGTGLAQRVLVNSRFTAAVFRRAYPRLQRLEPEILRPGVEVDRYPTFDDETGASTPSPMLLALHRYEAQKNAGLAIETLAGLRVHLPPSVFASARLVIAGGYDARVRENRDTLASLQRQADAHGVAAQVSFLRSIDDTERLTLLSRTACVLYTAENEHFGYVPLEAMAAGRPVIAVNSGGPCETIVDGETGYLCPARADEFARRVARVLLDPESARRMGRAGRAHVTEHFSLASFARRLGALVEEVAAAHRGS